MAKNSVSEWSTTPANNADVGNISIAEGTLAGNINNALRTIMAQIATLDPKGAAELAATYQPLSDTLTAIGDLEPDGDRQFAYTIGFDSWRLTGISSYTVTLMDNTDAAAWRTGLGLGGLATQNILDEDDFASDDPARPPSQQSVAAYVGTLPLAKSYESTAQTITAGGQLFLNHGLGESPKVWSFWIECTTSEFGFSVGDKLIVPPAYTSNDADTVGYSVAFTSTQLQIRFGVSDPFFVVRQDDGSRVRPTPANWQFYARAFA